MDCSNLPIITSPEIYSDIKTQKFHPDGILSEVIFGPINSYKCQCGHYNIRTFYEGKRCPYCNVLCESSELRYTTFAKIKLNVYVINPLYLSKFKPICENHPNLLDPVQTDLVSSTIAYLEFNKNRLKVVLTPNNNTSQIKIRGLYSLWLAIWDLYNKNNKHKKIEEYLSYFIDEIIVSPPQTRINFSLNGNEKEIENKLNKQYIHLIRLNNYSVKSLNFNIETLINTGEIYNYDFSDIDAIISKMQYRSCQIYENILTLLSNKSGMIRSAFLSRTIDFSSRSVLISNPTLKAYQVKLPKISFIKLWMIEFLRFLIIEKKCNKNQWIDIVKNTESLYVEYIEYFDEFINYYFNIKNTNYLDRLVLINRQPTLFRYGITCVEVVGVSDSNVTEISPFIMEQLNADCDGDTIAIYRLHNKKAIDEMQKTSFNYNNIKYDHTNEFLHTIRLESMYAFNLLTKMEMDNSKSLLNIQNLNDLNDNYEDLNQPIYFNNIKTTYGIGLINKWCGFDNILIKNKISNNEISELLLSSANNNLDIYHNKLLNLNKKLLWFISTNKHELFTIPFTSSLFDDCDETNILKKLPNNPYFGFYIHNAMIQRFISRLEKDKTNQICKLLGTKLNISQFSRSCLSIGYIADNFNIIRNKPITSNLFTGLTEDDFFETCYGTRKGIVDKSIVTPRSGYLERSMVMNLSPIEIDLDDCGSDILLPITIINQKHINSLINRWYLNPNTNSLQLFTTGNVGETYYFRSPITCKNPNFKICKKCFGNYNIPSKYVGILAAQYISERFTQLSMRSFHTSGSCSLDISKEIIQYLSENLIDIEPFIDNHLKYYKLKLKKLKFQDEFSKLEGFIRFDNNNIIIEDINSVIQNPDVSFIIKQFKMYLSKKGGLDILKVYEELMNCIMKNSNLFSIYIEIVLCNMFLTDQKKIVRYSEGDFTITSRLSIKKLYTIISNILGLLYEPNRQSILSIKDIKELKNFTPNSIYEKLWFSEL